MQQEIEHCVQEENAAMLKEGLSTEAIVSRSGTSEKEVRDVRQTVSLEEFDEYVEAMRQKAYDEAYKEGIAEGKEMMERRIIRNMLGKYSIEEISYFTDLPKDRILQVQQSMVC